MSQLNLQKKSDGDTSEWLSKRVSEVAFVAFDTETSGAFPVREDIVEFGAVKWQNGKEVSKLEFLFKPRRLMTDFIIGIHGISNEMVADCPAIEKNIHEIKNFLSDAIPVAHHAPFDMGFLSVEFEKNQIKIPTAPVLCTSLLSRRLIPETIDHKLQTLVRHFQFQSLAAHRAYEDARSCMMVLNQCLSRINRDLTIAELIEIQGKKLIWENFALTNTKNETIKNLLQAVQTDKRVLLVYSKGNKKNEIRTLIPQGVVRSPDGDYLQAIDPADDKSKRYKLEFISDVQVQY